MHDGTFGSFKTSRKERIDIRVGVERRRRWARDEKLRIVGESLEPNAVVTDVAQRNEVSASLIYVWRRQALAGLLEGFHRVEVVSETRDYRVSETRDYRAADAPLSMIPAQPGTASTLVRAACESTAPATRDAPAQATTLPAPRATIEVTLPGGAIVRVDGAVDAKALRTVLGALVPR